MLSAEAAPPDQSSQLRQYIGVLVVRKWSIAGIAALGLVGSLFFSFRQTPVYESTTSVLVKPVNNPFEPSAPIASLVNLDTEREVVESEAVAEIAAERITPAESVRDLLGHLSVTVPANTQVLEISFSDPNPLRAKQGADAFGEAYIDYKTAQARRAIDDLREPLLQQIDDLTAELQTLNERIAEAGTASPSQETLRDDLTSQLASIRTQLTPLNTILVDPGDILQTANLPSAPASPRHPVNAALGLIVGLTLGVGIAFLRERLDDSLKGWGALEASAGVPVLAIIPRVSGWRKRTQARLVTLQEPKSVVSEAYRTLRTSVLFAAGQQGVRRLLITSASAGEGKSTTAANLAVVLAHATKRVILVSADLRRPRVSRFFDIPNEKGLVDVLAGDSKLEDVLIDPGVEHLRLLSAGPIPARPNELLGSEAMGEVLDDLARIADFVLIDTPPILSVADALTLIPLCDAVLLVADAESTSRGAVVHARQRLEQVRAQMLGAVLNDFDPTKARAYPQAYYGYAYRYEYVEPRGGDGRARAGTSLQEELPRQRR